MRTRDKRALIKGAWVVALIALIIVAWLIAHPKQQDELTINRQIMIYTGWLVFVGILQAGVFAFQAGIFQTQAYWMRRASVDTKKALMVAARGNAITLDGMKQTERAFVSLDAFGLAESNINRPLIVVPKWKNTGQTPTRYLNSRVSWNAFNSEISDAYTFPDIIRERPLYYPNELPKLGIGAKRNVILPGAVVDGDTLKIPGDVVESAAKGEKHVYVWGWADYNDVFSRAKEFRHRTEFCYKLVPLFTDVNEIHEIKQRMHGDITNKISWVLHSRHNAADEECEGRLAEYEPPAGS